MKIWENGVIREMTEEEEALTLELIAAMEREASDPYQLIDILTGEGE